MEKQKFVVGNHEFSKLSIIPEVVLVHNIVSTIEADYDEDQGESSSIEMGSEQARYCFFTHFKNMITEGSTALRA